MDYKKSFSIGLLFPASCNFSSSLFCFRFRAWGLGFGV